MLQNVSNSSWYLTNVLSTPPYLLHALSSSEETANGKLTTGLYSFVPHQTVGFGCLVWFFFLFNLNTSPVVCWPPKVFYHSWLRSALLWLCKLIAFGESFQENKQNEMPGI